MSRLISIATATGALLALTAAAVAAPPAKTCDKAAFRLLIDVGHTDESPGAISARGIPEYQFNLKLARVIEHDMLEAGFAKTKVLITPGKAKPSLYQRVRDAHAIGGDLLLSIHHDAVPDSFVEKWEYEGQQRNFSDRFSGHSIFISGRNGARAASLTFGRMVGMEMKERGLIFTHHYTEPFMGRYRHPLLDTDAGVYGYDTLHVLKTARMPAVLLEAGSILNRDEELRVATPEHQATVSAAVLKAVENYCAGRRPPTLVAMKQAVVKFAGSIKRKLRGHQAVQHASAQPVRSPLDQQ